MSFREAMKTKLKFLAGLPPTGPTDAELDAIIRDVVQIQKERVPTEADWRTAAINHVPNERMYKYAGEDLSDLNRLLMMIQLTSLQGGANSNSTRK